MQRNVNIPTAQRLTQAAPKNNIRTRLSSYILTISNNDETVKLDVSKSQHINTPANLKIPQRAPISHAYTTKTIHI